VEWYEQLRDEQARTRIRGRLFRLSHGNPGDVRSVGGGVSEIRIDHGPGYRIYFTKIGTLLVLLLCGGDKDSQIRDIARAKRLAQALRNAGQ
jgi:putative addiction module killer protein